MKLDDFDYYLPPELIANEPSSRRDAARLMILNRSDSKNSEITVSDFPSLLNPGDLLVLNDTKVIPARLFGKKESGGKAEIFLVRRQNMDEEVWEALIRSSKPPLVGSKIILDEKFSALVIERTEESSWLVSFVGTGDFFEWLESHGEVPLPPYIKRKAEKFDKERYQTVYAKEPGAVAAPTAGLHFTPELLSAIKSKGIDIATLTLHVGLGTFMPVRIEDVTSHKMHKEWYTIPPRTVDAINKCKESGGRVIAIGTTTTRALEHSASHQAGFSAGTGEADIFIYPGYNFKVIDGLFTNFHLPKSTLLMLVSAFAGKEKIMQAYEEAIAREMRFYSYGDAMFII
ncbi:MAG: tRNA preQ1(34) S-adenosylmethionine ribosyltransferase-isomerase QueA [Desulfuromonadales bacterium]|nr:tRNA preQ1(34) S-adenosylmethionine ribosyltransferase-isomerase QueA [Desulfuromonadales bacterium]